jgi:hypothetical protein
MVLGELLDQITIYQLYHGMIKSKRKSSIDEVMPFGMS